MGEWIKEGFNYSWLQKTAMRVICMGPLPSHVAIIMDGNRRFARSHNLVNIQGHQKGFEKLSHVLEWCRDLNISEVTVYAFSIENFKRSKEEVDGLMQLAHEKLVELFKESELLAKYGVKICILGCLELLPDNVRQLAAQAALITVSHKKLQLNVALAYTGREEITAAAKLAAQGCKEGIIYSEDITEDLLEKCLYTSDSPPPDLLIRTSGEQRLSDFMLWQTGFSVLAFVKPNWPDFSLWHLLAAVFHYQCQYAAQQTGKLLYHKSIEISSNEDSDSKLRQENFLLWVHNKKLEELKLWADK